MNALKASIAVGIFSAAVTWCVVCFSIHKFPPRPGAGELVYTRCFDFGDNDEVTALLWAGGAHLVTFTSTLLLLRGPTREDVFAR